MTHQISVTCSTLRLQSQICRDRLMVVYPRVRHRTFIGYHLYDYYGFICRPPAHNIYISAMLAPCRSSEQTALHRVRSGIAHPCTRSGYGKDIGLRWLEAPRPPSRTEVHKFGWQFWLRLPSDPSLAPTSPFIPSSGSPWEFLQAPSPTYLLSGSVTGLSPVSYRPCRSHPQLPPVRSWGRPGKPTGSRSAEAVH